MERTLILRVPTASFVAINGFLEDQIQGCTSLGYEMFEDDFEFSGQEFLVDTVKISDNFSRVKGSEERLYESVVRSNVGLPKRNTLKCNLVTFENRNFNADRGCNVGCDDVMVEELVALFMGTVVDSSKLAQVCQDRLSSNEFLLGDWLDKRAPAAYRGLKGKLYDFVFHPSMLLKYTLMVKADVKPKLDDTPLYKYVTGQNIVYHDSCVTALFSCIFTAAVERLKFVVSENWVFYHGMDIDSLAQRISADLGDIRAYVCYELDISKYDKSQASLMKQVEELILLTLGVDREVLETFFCGEYDSLVSLASKELVLSVGSQRRSGGANTWLGNTVVLCTLLSVMLRGNEDYYVVVSGDDSLIFSKTELDIDTSSLSDNFGFDVKLFRQAVPYFCSKFLVQTDSGLFFVPDPLKLFIKLGVSRVADLDLLHEVYMSMVDITKNFGNEMVVSELVPLVARKYKHSGWTYSALCAIHVMSANFTQFCRLYYDRGNGSTLAPRKTSGRLSSRALDLRIALWKARRRVIPGTVDPSRKRGWS